MKLILITTVLFNTVFSVQTKLNYYWIANEWDYSTQGSEIVKSCTSDSTTAAVSTDFRQALYLHGTGRLNTGRLINCLDSQCTCFNYVDFPIGSHDNKLVKLVSIADTNSGYGTKLFIPKLKGFAIPEGGGVHNGCVRVDDECSDCVTGEIKLYTQRKELAEIIKLQIGEDSTEIEFNSDCEVQEELQYY
jgi:hypothetical protein